MNGGTRRPSLKDVARSAGVSYQTVSRVINKQGRVSPDTRTRVLEVVAEMGYRRNDAARALVTSRSHTIGVIADASPRFGPVSTLAAVESAAREAGYTALVTTVSNPSPETVVDLFAGFISRDVEGVIVIAPRVPLAHVTHLVSVSVPVVILSPGETSHDGYTVFYEDQEFGARLATRHLIDLGHRDIGHIAGSQLWLDGQVRLRGWQAEMHAAGLPTRAVWYGDWTGESAYAIGNKMVEGDMPSAVFVASDLMALALMRSFNEHGVAVPGDISIVGFDDNEFARHTSPPLTTVRQSFAAIGERCMEILLGLIADSPVDTTPLTPELIVRESSARPA